MHMCIEIIAKKRGLMWLNCESLIVAYCNLPHCYIPHPAATHNSFLFCITQKGCVAPPPKQRVRDLRALHCLLATPATVLARISLGTKRLERDPDGAGGMHVSNFLCVCSVCFSSNAPIIHHAFYSPACAGLNAYAPSPNQVAQRVTMMKKLFGGGSKQPTAAPPPAAPTQTFKPSSAASQTVDAIQKLGEVHHNWGIWDG